ncbi:MAG: double-strand break repair helicase AddA [Rhodobacterales bacterium]|nr:MAG: double-strand break repair helicase AddA [Rhodobacterales bacterium]
MTNEATQTQNRAARPDLSTWLTANAGSGKTRVLTDRVARLLLDGVEPQNILCLTYTKAAAGEMQNRLFATLGEWAMLDDDALHAALSAKGASQDLNPERLDQARRLFARAIETPGGLKIQTIHAFCGAILRRFPMEAGVSPQFREIDDVSAQRLRAEVLDEIAEGRERAVLEALARHQAHDLERLAAAVMSEADAFGQVPRDDLAAWLGADADRTPQSVLAATLGDALPDLLMRAVPILAAGSSTEIKAADKLRGLLPGRDLGPEAFEMLCGVCLYGEKTKAPFGSKAGKFPTAGTRKAHPELAADLDDLMDAVEALRPAYLAQIAFERTCALYAFAAVFVPKVQARMQAGGWLDFDDLIARTRDLLADPVVADWVLWRLDGGIDHILVDEAQDTSPTQWEVIRSLATELASGEGRRGDRPRTLFVVGDRKQSIYSFQGADPDTFDDMQAFFARQLAQADRPLSEETLAHSFRSAPAILDLVDRVFTGEAADGLEAHVHHKAFKTALPGRVDLWDPIEATPDDGPEPDPNDPVDLTRPTDASVLLATQIADQIRHMVTHETIPEDGPTQGSIQRRRVTPGDILILVRKRGPLFHAILTACKSAGLPVAGADRLKLNAEMAVRDLVALLSFLALPEDDLSLATVLRSPLGGWSERDLYRLAQPRAKGQRLWSALWDRRAEFPETVAMLDDLRARADYERPFDLLARVLGVHDGRARLLARLGEEAEEGIDALLSQALSYEQAEVPGLTGFLTWLEAEEVEIKRQMDSAGDAIRVMTVHGAKGLEAPVVILPDCAKPRSRDMGGLMRDGDLVIWPGAKPQRPDAVAELVAQGQAAQEREARRLLYVAMTRAEKWLIVAAAGDPGSGLESWHAMVAGAMTDAEPLPAPAGMRFASGDWDAPPMAERGVDPSGIAPAPMPSPAGPIAAAPEPLAPSDLGGAKALPGDDPGADRAQAMAEGTILHQLLELLPTVPAPARQALGQRIAGNRVDLVEDAVRLLDTPALAPVFAPDTLAEVEIAAPLPELGGRLMRGAIDRLIVTPDHVLAIDFKSNRIVPERTEHVPEGLLRQMGAYAAALAQVYPDRDIRSALLWTRTGTLMELPAPLTRAALERAGLA